MLGPFLPLCRQLGHLAGAIAPGGSIDRVEVEYLGRLADRDCRPLTSAVLLGIISGKTEDEVNVVNAPQVAAERGIVTSETKRTSARDFTELVRVTVVSGGRSERVVGTTLGRRHRPHLLEASGQRFNLQLDGHVALFRYMDLPGMIGRVGTIFGAHGVYIDAAAVGYEPDEGDDAAPREGEAVMVVTTHEQVPQELVDEIVASDDFLAGRAVDLT